MKHLFIFLFLFSIFSWAGDGHEHSASMEKVGKNEVLIKVHGMVCAFCAQGVEKGFGAREEVEEVKVDLDKMQVRVLFKEGKTLDEKVMKKIIIDSGFAYVGVKNE